MKEAEEDKPLSDKIEGAPHPSSTKKIFGQETASKEFLDLFTASRLHHAWLLNGPRGIGKATLAWQLTKFLLATPDLNLGSDSIKSKFEVPTTLEISPDHPISQRIAVGSEPGVFVLRRAYDEKRKRFKQVITVDEVRKLKTFFGLKSADAGRRIIIVDCADEMNANAANALLKILEEPPKNAFLFLISHQPARLLPTIRSRCRSMRLDRLDKTSVVKALDAANINFETSQLDSLTKLCGGSIGEALRILNMQGLQMYEEILEILKTVPRMNNKKVHVLANKFLGKGTSSEFELFILLVETALNRLVLSSVGKETFEHIAAFEEPKVFKRLSPDQTAAKIWAELAQITSERLRSGRAVNLDPTGLILDTFFKIEACFLRFAK